ncbi:MAG: 4a-hydroxytetrahydrobiopterin dehydratase [Mycobacteriaceae bacterium]
MATLLDASEIESALQTLPGWLYADGSLSLTAELAGFREALDAVAAVGDAAEQRNHHPDIDIRWRTVTFTCSSHSDGGVTAKDVELAQEISRLLESVA